MPADPRPVSLNPHPRQALKDSAQIPGMPQRVAPRLRPDREPVRLAPDLDLVDRAARRVDAIDDVVEAPGQPQVLAVGADVAHVGAAAARDRPVLQHLAAAEIEHRNAARPVALAVDLVTAAVGNVEALAIAARIEAV